MSHLNEQEFERAFWGDCTNTYDEEQKQYVYAQFMGLDQKGYGFDLAGRSVVDIGGGPVSLLLKCRNLGSCTVVDPLEYPSWTQARYSIKGISVNVVCGESFKGRGYDEAWIYNCLQHTDDPKLIIQNAKEAASVLRIFEWIDIPPHPGHPHQLTKASLDEWIGSEGKTVRLNTNGCYGHAYYQVINT